MNSFAVSFLPVSADFFGVDDDDKVAGIEVRRVHGLVFAAQNVGDLHGQPAEHGAIGINHVPLPLVQIYFRQMCFHCYPNKRERESIRRTDEVNKLFDGKVACRRRPIP